MADRTFKSNISKKQPICATICKKVLRQLSKGRLSKETFVQGTIVQGTIVQGTIVQGMIVQEDFCPRRLLSKEAFRYDKLARIIFSLSLMKIHMSNLIEKEKTTCATSTRLVGTHAPPVVG